MKAPYHFKSISDFHRVRNLPQPKHPLVSIIELTSAVLSEDEPRNIVFDFFAIALKSASGFKVKYGQESFDFDSGTMLFSAPGQVISFETTAKNVIEQSGWMLLVHPDFLWNTPLAQRIKQYDFFNYSVNEALFVSEEEKEILSTVFKNIKQESRSAIDTFTQEIIISQIETLLAYSERFYQRQFITRKKVNHQILTRLEEFLDNWFTDEKPLKNGLPTVNLVANELNVSPHYLSDLLRSLTGLNTQQHIHEKLINKSKELLSTTELTVSEIAYQLGFEQIQSFSKLFKNKTNQSPLEFRQSFN